MWIVGLIAACIGMVILWKCLARYAEAKLREAIHREWRRQEMLRRLYGHEEE